MTITTHEQPPRLGRGKHETLNLLMARCRVLSGFFFLSLALAVSKMLKVITNSLIKIYFIYSGTPFNTTVGHQGTKKGWP